MSRKIVVAGATGLIGKILCWELIKKGEAVFILTRDIENARKKLPGAAGYIDWSAGEDELGRALSGAAAVVNLAGESVMAKRWSSVQKEKILKSRIGGTNKIVDAIARAEQKPEVFVCASATGYYGSREDEVDENSLPGSDFLSSVTVKWEEAAARAEKFGVRRVSVRIGIVLDKNDGALAKMLLPFRLFIGGPLGSGKQWFPWIHIKDLIGIILYAIENKNISGAVNAVSPGIVRMDEFSRELGRALHRPVLFRVPSFILKIVMGEAAVAVLEGAKVIPNILKSSGYKFRYQKVGDALKNIFSD